MSTPVTLRGNLGADPALTFTPAGKAICKFNVITSKNFKNDKGDWENSDVTGWWVTVWNQQAEYVAESLQRGDAVVVIGTAADHSWEDAKTKEKRHAIQVTAQEVAASFKRTPMKINRSKRAEGGASANQGSDDPWSAAPVGGGWASNSDGEPPF